MPIDERAGKTVVCEADAAFERFVNYVQHTVHVEPRELGSELFQQSL